MAARKIGSCLGICRRPFSTSNVCFGKRNFRKFPLYNFRGTEDFRKRQAENPDPDIPLHTYGVRPTGYKLNGRFHEIPEMIPDIIVPDLKDCELKPYVSYRTVDVVHGEFTAQDLFDAVYSKKIEDDYQAGKLDANGQPLEPSANEKLTAEEATLRARQTGSDLF